MSLPYKIHRRQAATEEDHHVKHIVRICSTTLIKKFRGRNDELVSEGKNGLENLLIEGDI